MISAPLLQWAKERRICEEWSELFVCEDYPENETVTMFFRGGRVVWKRGGFEEATKNKTWESYEYFIISIINFKTRRIVKNKKF